MISPVRLAHTSLLQAAELSAARALLYDVFDDMTEADWEHALGGMHALVFDGADLVAHGSVVMRRLVYQGRALRTGYVEAMAVRADRRRQGLGAAVLSSLEQVIRGAYELGALGASDEGVAFYRSRGWLPWQGPTFALTVNGVVRTPDEDDCIFVLPVTEPLDRTAALTCDLRPGDAW